MIGARGEVGALERPGGSSSVHYFYAISGFISMRRCPSSNGTGVCSEGDIIEVCVVRCCFALPELTFRVRGTDLFESVDEVMMQEAAFLLQS